MIVFADGELQVNDVNKSPDEWKLRSCEFVHPTEGEYFKRSVWWQDDVGRNIVT